ncbi:MAG: hypothetical protein R2799_02900 [Crocinitomicaceae bacterium]
MNYIDILDRINERYVLLKLNRHYYIIDKANNNSILIISDPIINYHQLIKEMKKRGVEVHDNIDDISELSKESPRNIYFYKSGKILNKGTDEEVKTVNLILKKIFNQHGKETGSIISAVTDKHVNSVDKERLERMIQNYAFHNLYPRQGINIYSDIHKDTVSLVIIKDTNSLEYKELDPIEKTIIDWDS